MTEAEDALIVESQIQREVEARLRRQMTGREEERME